MHMGIARMDVVCKTGGMEMNTEKDMRTWYQHTFDEVHASEDLLRKANTMKNENEMYKAKKKLSKGAVAAAAFALLMLSNVISYAASGRAWIMTITLPDGETRQIELEQGPDEGQYFVYEDSSDSAVSESRVSTETEVTLEVSDDDSAHRLEEIDGRIWLILNDQSRVDITEDFQDGTCKGTLETDDITWYYEVDGSLEDYEIQVQLITFVENGCK